MKLFSVVVLYNMHPSVSPAIRSLIDSMGKLPSDSKINLLVWDNTPGGQTNIDLPEWARYYASENNAGLARAYNKALRFAETEGYEWLLTLDQDTTLPEDYLLRIHESIRNLDCESLADAFVPHVRSDGRFISPFHFRYGVIPYCCSIGDNGLMQVPTYAVNSAAVLRVSSLVEIRGYNPLFPLNASDLDMFHRLNRYGGQIFVVAGLVVEHDFAMLNPYARMTISRYHSQLVDECAFWDSNMGPLARLERILRLIARSYRDRSVKDSKEFSQLNMSEVKRRLFTPRKERLEAWQDMAYRRATRPSADLKADASSPLG